MKILFKILLQKLLYNKEIVLQFLLTLFANVLKNRSLLTNLTIFNYITILRGETFVGRNAFLAIIAKPNPREKD